MDIARPQWTFLERLYNILLYCLDALQIQFLISYWLNFISLFFFGPCAHLLLTAGFPLCCEKDLNLFWASGHAIFEFLWADIMLTSFSSTSWLGLTVFWSTSTPFKKECEVCGSSQQKLYVSLIQGPFMWLFPKILAPNIKPIAGDQEDLSWKRESFPSDEKIEHSC